MGSCWGDFLFELRFLLRAEGPIPGPLHPMKPSVLEVLSRISFYKSLRGRLFGLQVGINGLGTA